MDYAIQQANLLETQANATLSNFGGNLNYSRIISPPAQATLPFGFRLVNIPFY